MKAYWVLQVCVILCAPFSISGSIADLELPEPMHNISSIVCIIRLCEKYFRSVKRVIGSLVIVNFQNTTEFQSQLIIMLNEHADYELGVMVKDATKKHHSTVHVVDKAKNYFVMFDRSSEVADAINQWYVHAIISELGAQPVWFSSLIAIAQSH